MTDAKNMFFVILLGIIPVLGAQVLLPELTGPHSIGLRNLELVDYDRVDPFSPSDSPRDLMVTLYYPTSTASSLHRPLAPQFSPATASYVDSLLTLPPGTASSLTTRAHLDAPLGNEGSQAPVLLFSHGFGFTRGLYTSLLQDLASWGWIAVAVDHPYDAAVVEYPDGRTVHARNWSWPLDAPVRELVLNTRVADLLFVLEQLGGTDKLKGGLHMQQLTDRTIENDTLAPIFNVSRVVALGHSFGGATAVEALLNSSAVIAAADLDGFLYGPVVRLGTEKPVLVLGFPEHFATDDPTAAPGWPALHGWKKDFTVAGTVHESYTDYPVFADIWGDEGPEAGNVAGKRMVEIQRTYIDAFFRKFLLNVEDDGFLSSNSSQFSEVVLRRSGS
ncbi:platelet-activating factor acetylhydrolase, isoform II-domain-containing protein [Hypoxylon fuscum]|nr:platelet-activating factor acetylhydrolase, isoform II-domain-containing protein [Hypoxylon fuscum]